MYIERHFLNLYFNEIETGFSHIENTLLSYNFS